MSVESVAEGVDDILNVVDLARYPIHDLESESGRAFLEGARGHMAARGWCNFDDFIRPEAVEALAEEAKTLLPGAETLTIKRTVYGGQVDASAPEGDPRRREYVHRALQLADDQIPGDSLIKRLYHSDVLTDFVARVQAKPRLYR